MTAGRPPKPTALKILSGNPGKRAINEGEPRPPAGPILPPSWLHGRSRTAWKWVAPVLEQMGVLTTADTHAVALLCDAYAEYIECRAVVRTLGRTYESRIFKASTRRVAEATADEKDDVAEAADFAPGEWSVIIRPRPEVQMASESRRYVLRMFSEFGMTASSRSKITVGTADDPADPFEAWERGSSSAS